MALHDPVITMESVTYSSQNRFNITFKLVIPDNTVGCDGIDQTFTFLYRQGVVLTAYLDALDNQMQAAIDKYKAEMAIKTAGVVPTFISALTGRLEV